MVTTVTGPSNSSGFLSKEGYTILGDSLMWMNKCESDKTGSWFIWLIKFYFGRVWSNLLISTRMAGLFLSLLRTFFVIKMSWLFCCYVQFDISRLCSISIQSLGFLLNIGTLGIITTGPLITANFSQTSYFVCYRLPILIWPRLQGNNKWWKKKNP